MPIALTETPFEPLTLEPPRKHRTREECAKAEVAGLFDQQHLELVHGELISKAGKRRPHVDAVSVLFAWLVRTFGVRRTNVAAPIDVSPEDNRANEPEPDLIVLREEFKNFRSANPRPEDLALVIEVADTTLAFDLSVKRGLYARAGIAEYWVLDLAGRRLIVHRQVQGGRYESVVAYAAHEGVGPLAAPEKVFRVAGAFPE